MYYHFKQNGQVNSNENKPTGGKPKPNHGGNKPPQNSGGNKPGGNSGGGKPGKSGGKSYCVYCRTSGHTKDNCDKLATKRRRDAEKTDEPKEKIVKK